MFRKAIRYTIVICYTNINKLNRFYQNINFAVETIPIGQLTDAQVLCLHLCDWKYIQVYLLCKRLDIEWLTGKNNLQYWLSLLGGVLGRHILAIAVTSSENLASSNNQQINGSLKLATQKTSNVQLCENPNLFNPAILRLSINTNYDFVTRIV